MAPASPDPRDDAEPRLDVDNDGLTEAESVARDYPAKPGLDNERAPDDERGSDAERPSVRQMNGSSAGLDEDPSASLSTSSPRAQREVEDQYADKLDSLHPDAPPLPSEPQPNEDDGWTPIWDPAAQAYYFYNTFTQASTWDNPRLPSSRSEPPPPTAPRPHGGYDPAIHGDYDPTASYAQESPEDPAALEVSSTVAVPSEDYTAAAHFSRFSSRFVDPNNPAHASYAPGHHDDEHKSKRQMGAFFDVEAAANSHDGRSLKAERQGKKLSKKEVKAFKEKRKSKKEEKRRAWLRD